MAFITITVLHVLVVIKNRQVPQFDFRFVQQTGQPIHHRVDLKPAMPYNWISLRLQKHLELHG